MSLKISMAPLKLILRKCVRMCKCFIHPANPWLCAFYIRYLPTPSIVKDTKMEQAQSLHMVLCFLREIIHMWK
jgi:hypothetical protein